MHRLHILILEHDLIEETIESDMYNESYKKEMNDTRDFIASQIMIDTHRNGANYIMDEDGAEGSMEECRDI